MGQLVRFPKRSQIAPRRPRRWRIGRWVPIRTLTGAAVIGALIYALPHEQRPIFTDRNCADFATQGEAQAFFRAQGPGDPHRLDDDGDGRACEAKPR
jgi:Excalibur calcium-binding domain